MKSNRFWLLVFVIIVIVSALAAFLLRQPSGSYAHIYQDGELTETVNIDSIRDPFTITVETSGNKNVIAVEQGRIRMLSADCPDGSCVRQGWISGGIFPIVCLPNRVVITLEHGDNRSNVDAVVG